MGAGVLPLAKKSVLNSVNLVELGYPFNPYKASTTLFIFFLFLVRTYHHCISIGHD